MSKNLQAVIFGVIVSISVVVIAAQDLKVQQLKRENEEAMEKVRVRIEEIKNQIQNSTRDIPENTHSTVEQIPGVTSTASTAAAACICPLHFTLIMNKDWVVNVSNLDVEIKRKPGEDGLIFSPNAGMDTKSFLQYVQP